MGTFKVRSISFHSPCSLLLEWAHLEHIMKAFLASDKSRSGLRLHSLTLLLDSSLLQAHLPLWDGERCWMGCTWRRFRLEPGTVSTKWIFAAVINNHLKPRNSMIHSLLIWIYLGASGGLGSILPRFCWLVSAGLQNSAFTPVPMTGSTMCRSPQESTYSVHGVESLPLKNAFSISLCSI